MTRPLSLIGRSSSHFTRIVRVYAAELGLDVGFEPVLELMSSKATIFGDNPLLTVPSLRTPEGTWFGSLNCSRALARHAGAAHAARAAHLVWPEDARSPLEANAQEVVTSAMNAGVSIIMGRACKLDDSHPAMEKPLARLAGALAWLEQNLDAAVARMPEGKLSYLEVSGFCFLEHLAFRGLGSLEAFPKLRAFCIGFAVRSSARSTEYRFDP